MNPFVRASWSTFGTGHPVVPWPPPPIADVPGRVGRIAYLQGDVQGVFGKRARVEGRLREPAADIAQLGSSSATRGAPRSASARRRSRWMPAPQVDIQQLDDNTFNANVVPRPCLDAHQAHGCGRRLQRRDARMRASRCFSRAAIGSTRSTTRAASRSSRARRARRGQRSSTLVNAGSALRVVGDPSNPDAPPQFLRPASPRTARARQLGRRARGALRQQPDRALCFGRI